MKSRAIVRDIDNVNVAVFHDDAADAAGIVAEATRTFAHARDTYGLPVTGWVHDVTEVSESNNDHVTLVNFTRTVR